VISNRHSPIKRLLPSQRLTLPTVKVAAFPLLARERYMLDFVQFYSGALVGFVRACWEQDFAPSFVWPSVISS
jgi:hypothetical protein